MFSPGRVALGAGMASGLGAGAQTLWVFSPGSEALLASQSLALCWGALSFQKPHRTVCEAGVGEANPGPMQAVDAGGAICSAIQREPHPPHQIARSTNRSAHELGESGCFTPDPTGRIVGAHTWAMDPPSPAPTRNHHTVQVRGAGSEGLAGTRGTANQEPSRCTERHRPRSRQGH